jgi:hypothetical protein
MTVDERVLAALRELAASDAELAERGRADWGGWADLGRVRRWLAVERPPPAEATVRRALGRLVKVGSAQARDGEWRAV